MTSSLPSNKALFIDVPDVRSFAASFEYNFWTRDEFENGEGSLPAVLQEIPTEGIQATYTVRTRKFPRIVKLSWLPCLVGQYDQAAQVSIRENITKIKSETDLTSDRFCNIQLQDNGIDRKLQFFLSQLESTLSSSISVPVSPMQRTELLNDATTAELRGNFIGSVNSDLASKGILVDAKRQKADILGLLKNVKLELKLNNKLVNSLFASIKEDSVGIFADEFSESITQQDLNRIQQNAITNSSDFIGLDDYELELTDYLDFKQIDSTGFEPKLNAIGYIIEKRELKQNGEVQVYSDLIVESPRTCVFADPRVRYGSTYFYTIRAVYTLEVFAIDERTNQNILVRFLVCSRRSQDLQVKTEEMVAPPPPADFDLSWDYGTNALRCIWNLPVNPQQDIKYIQLFKRNNINEPFQLIRMWDFNNSTTRISLPEYPLPELVSSVTSFVGSYLDLEFTKDSKAIYAVTALDAHGLTSNYSIQLGVSFDRFRNVLVKKLVSSSGAPKPYPNAYLNQDTFVDTMKDSGHSKIRVVFNPEYLEMVNSLGQEVDLLKTDLENGKYKLQVINIESRQQADLDIILEDRRKTKNPDKITNALKTVTQFKTGNGIYLGQR